MHYNKYSSTTSLSSQDYHSNSLLNQEQAAEIMGLNPQTLAVWRCNGRYTLPYVKVGRLVKYKYSDILTFIEQQTHNISQGE